MTLTELLRSEITDSGKSYFSIARESGVNYATVYQFHKRRQSLKLETAEKLLVYFGLTVKGA